MLGSRRRKGAVEEGGRENKLANSASSFSRMKPYSISSRALKTSAGIMVFLLAERVLSFALESLLVKLIMFDT